MTNRPPNWNFFDTGYSVAGVFFAAVLWGLHGEAAWFSIILLFLAYMAGRAAGSHR